MKLRYGVAGPGRLLLFPQELFWPRVSSTYVLDMLTHSLLILISFFDISQSYGTLSMLAECPVSASALLFIHADQSPLLSPSSWLSEAWSLRRWSCGKGALSSQ